MIPIFGKRISAIVYFSVTSSISLFILILISIVVTWIIRGWLTISGVDYKFPTNFIFQPCTQSGVCSFPWATIDLRRPYSVDESILAPDLRYSASLRFRVSDSQSNRLAGMFMVKFSMENSQGRILSYCSTSTTIPYRSNLIRTFRRLFFWPLLIFDYLQEYHSIFVVCPDPIWFTKNGEWATILRVEIQNMAIQIINDGTVELSAHLRGLQYYFYFWPIFSSFGLFFAVFWCCTSIGCGFWLIKSMARKSIIDRSNSNRSDQQQQSPPSLPTPSPMTNEDFPVRKNSFLDDIPTDLDFRPTTLDNGGNNRYSSNLRRMYGELESEEDVHCFQRRLSSRMQNALLDLDDSNLGS